MSYPIDPIATAMYSLRGPRQTRSMVFTCDIWGPDPTVAWDATTNFAPVNIKLYTGVPFSIQPTQNTAEPGAIGLTAGEYLQVLDKAYFHLSQPIQAGWSLKITAEPTGSSVMVGQWRAIMGPPLDMGWRAMTRMALCKIINHPSWGS